jgi:ATP-dependent helicase/nuclease subunit B
VQNGARGLFDAAGAGHTILVPNSELAAALFDAVERMHVEAGHDLWPTPRIREFGSWLRECYGERQRSDASLPRVLSDIEERELWRAVILESAAGGEFLEPAGAARSARRARRAMFEYGIPMGSLAQFPTEETLALINWNRGFEDRTRDLGCIASDQLLGAARPDSRNLVWIESPIWRPVARAWLQRNAAAVLHPTATPEAAYPRRLQSASPDAELAAIAEWAREGLRATPDFRAWICILDLNLRRSNVLDAFDAALMPQRFSLTVGETASSYAVAGGIPLSRYAPVQAALDSLAATVGRVPFEAFSALLRSPELQSSGADAADAAALDLILRRRGPHEADLTEWIRIAETESRAKLSRPVAAVARLNGFLRAIEAVEGHHPFSRWVSLWVGAFEAGPWAHRSGWSSAEFQAAERFRELLATLATADASFGALTMVAAGRTLARAARDTAFQPQTGVPAIWVTGQIMDPWLAYDGLWIAGCSEDRWPPPLDPIPLLPIRLQREYGVVAASADMQMQLAEDLQRRWRLRAATNVFSCADGTEGRPAAFSPLISAAPLVSAASIPEDAAPATHPHWRVAAARAPRLEPCNDERAPPFAAPERMRGIATLRAQSRCAFRGFAETRLQAETPEKPVPGFNMRERGEMLHHALEHIWSNLRSSARLEATAPDALGELVKVGVERAVARQCRRRDPGLHWQRREVPRMSALLGKWLETERMREPFDVESLEQATHTARYAGLEFDVRIDRIDRLDGGGRVLIDYKSGMAVQDWRGDRPDNPQLPVYAVLQPHGLLAVAYAKVNAGECGFVAETARRGIFKPQSGPTTLEGMPDFAALVALWSQRIEKIAGEFAAGHAEVAPTLRACASCDLQTLCRVPAAFDDGEARND